MALIEKVLVYWARLDPQKPNKQFKPENPTWEVQLRTTSKEQKKEWEELKLNVRPEVPDEGEAFYKVNLKKNSISMEGKPNDPVKVVDVGLRVMDPKIIGNGSLCNVRVYQREYKDKLGKPAIQSILMGVQVLELVPYEAKEVDDDFQSYEAF